MIRDEDKKRKAAGNQRMRTDYRSQPKESGNPPKGYDNVVSGTDAAGVRPTGGGSRGGSKAPPGYTNVVPGTDAAGVRPKAKKKKTGYERHREIQADRRKHGEPGGR